MPAGFSGAPVRGKTSEPEGGGKDPLQSCDPWVIRESVAGQPGPYTGRHEGDGRQEPSARTFAEFLPPGFMGSLGGIAKSEADATDINVCTPRSAASGVQPAKFVLKGQHVPISEWDLDFGRPP